MDSCKRIKLMVMDVDGTLTDGKIYMGNNGEIMKAFDIKDGCGIHDILLPSGIKPVIITGRNSEILKNRCREIGIDLLYQGVKDKEIRLEKVLLELNCTLSEVAYIGDDINDLPCMAKVKAAGGIIGCPKDAVESVKYISDFISKKDGGRGAVRDFIEYVVTN